MDNTDGLNINELCMSDRPNTLFLIDSLNKKNQVQFWTPSFKKNHCIRLAVATCNLRRRTHFTYMYIMWCPNYKTVSSHSIFTCIMKSADTFTKPEGFCLPRTYLTVYKSNRLRIRERFLYQIPLKYMFGSDCFDLPIKLFWQHWIRQFYGLRK